MVACTESVRSMQSHSLKSVMNSRIFIVPDLAIASDEGYKGYIRVIIVPDLAIASDEGYGSGLRFRVTVQG